MISKYAKSVTKNVPSKVPKKEETSVKMRKKRKPRTQRLFHYRGTRFLCVSRGDNTIIHMWDLKTDRPMDGLVVPREKARSAIQALAKIQGAEKALEDIGAQPVSNA